MKWISFKKVFDNYQEAVEYAEQQPEIQYGGGTTGYGNILTCIFQVTDDEYKKLKKRGYIK